MLFNLLLVSFLSWFKPSQLSTKYHTAAHSLIHSYPAPVKYGRENTTNVSKAETKDREGSLAMVMG